jgi:serine/threonine-protein kinase
VAAGAVTFVAAVVGTRFGGSDPFLYVQTGFLLASWAAFAAFMSWTLYAALEPYVRRQWPQMLISWSRLLDGRWRDSLVGRDMLVGVVLALAINIVQEFQEVIRLWRGEPPTLSSPGMMLGLPETFADVLGTVPSAVWIALGIAMMLVLLRLILRSKIAAAIGFVVIMTVPGAFGNNDPLVALAFQVLMFGVWVAIATRFGLVMLATCLLVDQLSFGGGFSAPSFAQSSVLFRMAVVAAIGGFGFYAATRGRKASGWLDE